MCVVIGDISAVPLFGVGKGSVAHCKKKKPCIKEIQSVECCIEDGHVVLPNKGWFTFCLKVQRGATVKSERRGQSRSCPESAANGMPEEPFAKVCWDESNLPRSRCQNFDHCMTHCKRIHGSWRSRVWNVLVRIAKDLVARENSVFKFEIGSNESCFFEIFGKGTVKDFPKQSFCNKSPMSRNIF